VLAPRFSQHRHVSIGQAATAYRSVHQNRVHLVMKTRVLTALLGLVLCAAPAFAQQKTVTGKVTDEQGSPLTGVSVVIKGTTVGVATGGEGNYSIRVATGQVLQFRFIGTTPVERTVGSDNVLNVQLHRAAVTLNALVVTALGQTTEQRALGTAQQTVRGADIAQTQRENFVNALQGRIAGVDVTTTSGVPGASSSITIRGVSSISSSNQPLFIVDGLPIDNKTTNTANLASDAPTSALAFNNRGVDFTNRAADINPEDIESLVVLKGPEAAALYGIDAANGAIVITTKRGRPGAGGFDYSNSFRIENVDARPDIQTTYGPSGTVSPNGTSVLAYFGAPYPTGTQFYDNINSFFQTGVTQKHNLSFNGAAADSRVTYHISSAFTKQRGVIPNTGLNKINLTGASQGQVANWLNVDLSMNYSYNDNDQPFKGENGPAIGLLTWPDTNNAADYLTPTGTRLRVTTLSAGSEVDNPFFSVYKNKLNAKTNRIFANAGFTISPYSWGYLKSNIGADTYTNQTLIVRHPESASGFAYNGIFDQNDDITRNLNAQTILNLNAQAVPHVHGLTFSALVGNSLQDNKSTVDGSEGTNFLDPNFISINNSLNKSSRTIITQRRLVSAFGQAVANYRDLLYVTVTGRNDWTSTIPEQRNSFFYPSISSSFIFTDAFPSLRKFMTGKLRAAYAEVGRDALPYSYRTSLESKTTSFGGYGYGFTGPNPNLGPEFAKSYEIGTELGFLNDRLGVDATVYRKRTENQIVTNLRGSYGTGFILFNLNGASTENKGLELTVRGTPVISRDFTWDVLANFASARGKTLSLPNALPEFYVSDTWLYRNVRNGTEPGLSTLSLTGLFYRRNKNGAILIDPTTGLPLRTSTFVDAGYDRQPNFTIGLSNSLKYKRFNLSFLFDIRRGGDVFDATDHFLTIAGLARNTLDRNTPRVIQGVLRDGKENSDTPTPNSISIVPAIQTGYYTSISEELFIEKNINWLRLRDATLTYTLPERFARSASVFITGTDLFLWTNYVGMDPISNGNDAAVGGSGGVGIDYAAFPIPRGINFGLRFGF
jgi:TonB-linked SusC/RagA family outer membrane protein